MKKHYEILTHGNLIGKTVEKKVYKIDKMEKIDASMTQRRDEKVYYIFDNKQNPFLIMDL